METTLSFRVPFSVILFTLFFAAPFFAKATTFYTLADGNWSNSTNVWSTDGATPCACTPNILIDTFDVRISHKITHFGTITLGNGRNLTLNPNGDLIMSSGQFRLRTGGTLLNNGSMTLRKMDTEPNSNFTSNGPVTITNDIVDIRSIFNLNNVFTIVSGDLIIAPTGVLNLGQISKMDLQSSDIYNSGAIIFGNASCSKVLGGNFFIHPGSVILGIGSVVSSGVIHTDGFWDANVNWCAQGGRAGFSFMPPENCPVANSVCGVILPVSLASFEGAVTPEQAVQLVWQTDQETHAGQFHLSKSLDGVHFSQIGTVAAQNSSNTLQDYHYTDFTPQPGTQFYRLELTDLDGTFYTNLATIEVKLAQPENLEITTFPNPFQDQLQLAIHGEALEGTLRMELTDLNGAVLQSISTEKTVTDTRFHLDTRELAPGFYLLKVNIQGETRVKRMVKQ